MGEKSDRESPEEKSKGGLTRTRIGRILTFVRDMTTKKHQQCVMPLHLLVPISSFHPSHRTPLPGVADLDSKAQGSIPGGKDALVRFDLPFEGLPPASPGASPHVRPHGPDPDFTRM
ncbi:hypothetical protein [Paludisphaera soli]|uniref:hypothetical protein n=1 Tax=Paludisphaera soli TaxID=2712865 RepID=UPI0013ED501E|nr:hypothetical protein [Paludisphaera soli]